MGGTKFRCSTEYLIHYLPYETILPIKDTWFISTCCIYIQSTSTRPYPSIYTLPWAGCDIHHYHHHQFCNTKALTTWPSTQPWLGSGSWSSNLTPRGRKKRKKKPKCEKLEVPSFFFSSAGEKKRGGGVARVNKDERGKKKKNLHLTKICNLDAVLRAKIPLLHDLRDDVLERLPLFEFNSYISPRSPAVR